MKSPVPPLIVLDQGDTYVFDSVEAMVSDIEQIDAAVFEIFDAAGIRWFPRPDGNR